MFELKKDIHTPSDYYRAGTQKTKEEWETIFPGCFDFQQNEWFLDIEAIKEFDKFPIKIMGDIVDSIFRPLQLHSVSYKLAAIKCLEKYDELQKQKQ
jgi:hypothetical protein